jgi:hypothetical protein
MPTHEPNITLNGVSVALTSTEARAFILWACRAGRAGEGLCSDDYVCQEFELSPEDLKNLARNKLVARESKYPPAEPGAYMRPPESRVFCGCFNARRLSAFMA